VHSSCLHISRQEIGLADYKCWLALLKNASRQFNNADTRTFKMPLRMLWASLGNNSNRCDKHLKSVLTGLVKHPVRWNLRNKDKETEWGVATLLAGCRIKGGLIEYDYSSFLLEQLKSPRMFALLDLKMLGSFKSKYGLALFCLLEDYKNLGKSGLVPLSTFRELMGVSVGEYQEFKSLNRRVLKPAIDEVNRLSNLEIAVQLSKECRKVVGLSFQIKKGEPVEIKEASPLLDKMLRLNIARPQAERLLAIHSDSRITNNIAYVKSQLSAGKIKSSTAGYAVTAIEKDFYGTSPAKELESKKLAHKQAVDALAIQSEKERSLRTQRHNLSNALLAITLKKLPQEALDNLNRQFLHYLATNYPSISRMHGNAGESARQNLFISYCKKYLFKLPKSLPLLLDNRKTLKNTNLV